MNAELEDFEAFVEPEFDPLKFTASLLLATNVADDSELDLATPIKKLQFDANECDKRMEKLASTHYDLFIQNLSKIESTRALMAGNINPLVERVKKLYDRIQTDVVAPYEEAVKLNEALKRVHSTLTLLRSAGFFTLFVQQLQDCEQAMEALDDNREIVRLARLHRQITELYAQNLSEDDTADLLSLRLVRDYQPIYRVKLADLTSDLSQKISNDLGHHSSFYSDNETLQNNMLALQVLDQKELYNVLEKGAMSKSIQVALALLTRSLQSPRNFGSVLSEVQQTSESFSVTLTELLESCRISKDSNETLFSQFQRSQLEGNDVEYVYWTRLAYKFKKNIAATMARGGPIARNLKTSTAGINSAIKSGLKDSLAELLLDSVSIVN